MTSAHRHESTNSASIPTVPHASTKGEQGFQRVRWQHLAPTVPLSGCCCTCILNATSLTSWLPEYDTTTAEQRPYLGGQHSNVKQPLDGIDFTSLAQRKQASWQVYLITNTNTRHGWALQSETSRNNVNSQDWTEKQSCHGHASQGTTTEALRFHSPGHNQVGFCNTASQPTTHTS
jgi:hypothetical protein